MKGIVGRFFFQFGITVTFAVLVSLFVSFTLDPMLSSRWVDPDIERKGKETFDRPAPRPVQCTGLTGRRISYRFVIAWALDHRMIILVHCYLAFFGGLFVFFIPSE